MTKWKKEQNMLHHTRRSVLPSRRLAAWQDRVPVAAPPPGLPPPLEARGSDLWPRFAAYYATLQALPRRVRRAMQRQWRQSLAGIALLLALGVGPVPAATIQVTGSCTLVDAITAANTDTTTGGCPAGRRADKIVLPAGSTQTLSSVHNDTYGPTGLPVIGSPITIAGRGSTIERENGAPLFRLFAVGSTGELTLHNTTVSGGVVPDERHGGGLANYGGTCTVLHSTITGNGAYGGGGVANHGGTCTVLHSAISGNTASRLGGGVLNHGGNVTVTHSIISDNGPRDEFFYGGGVANYAGGTLTVTHSTISGNTARSVGGVLNLRTLAVVNSTISGNFVPNSGGGASNTGTLTVINSTISDNAASSGGGMVNSGTLRLANTLVAGNTAPNAPEISNSARVFANHHNLFGVDGTAGVQGFRPGPTDVVPAAGVLLPDILDPTLADNGGPTLTHALVPGSPAIDAIPPSDRGCRGADQRGGHRPQGAGCDIGAFEADDFDEDDG